MGLVKRIVNQKHEAKGANPKSEYRNPKQFRILKIQMTKTRDKSFGEFRF